MRTGDNWDNLDLKLEFLMDNYDIVSLEKCLTRFNGDDHNTEKIFLYLTSKMRSLRPKSNTRILFYWHAAMIYEQCYQSTREFISRPDLLLRDSSGELILSKGAKMLDFRLPEARSMWANGRTEINSLKLKI